VTTILDRFRLDGKVALVTGANRGLGRATALALAQAGADIAGVNRSDDDGGLRHDVMQIGVRYRHAAFDLAGANPAALAMLVADVVRDWGHLDILINNAGIIRRASVLEYSEADWDAVLQVNLKAAFFLAQAAAAVMRDQGGGKIINIASLLSYQGGIRVPAYTAAKHGIIGITQSLANELAPHHINVNAIAPGYIETDNTLALRADEARNHAILERIPAGRWGQPEDIQGAVVLLASSAGDYLHGSVITVDGGWMGR
jgi:2-deoxy-D-gluconate 3-dehydrogenase